MVKQTIRNGHIIIRKKVNLVSPQMPYKNSRNKRQKLEKKEKKIAALGKDKELASSSNSSSTTTTKAALGPSKKQQKAERRKLRLWAKASHQIQKTLLNGSVASSSSSGTLVNKSTHKGFVCCVKKNPKKCLSKGVTENTEKKVDKGSVGTQQLDNIERPFVFSKAKWNKKYNHLTPW